MDLQRKKDSFREEIRKKHLESYFARKREQFQSQNDFTIPSQGIQEEMYKAISQFIQGIQISKERKAYYQMFQIIDKFGYQISRYPEHISYCFGEFLHLQSQVLEKLMCKQISYDVLGSTQQQSPMQRQTIEETLPFALEIEIVLKLIDLGMKLKVEKFKIEPALMMMKSLSAVLHEKYHLPIQQYPQTHKAAIQILEKLLQLITNLLRNQQNKDRLIEYLEESGFDEKLNTILDIYNILADSTHQKILNLLMVYLERKQEKKQSEGSFEVFQEVHLVKTNSEFRKKQLSYCLYFLIHEQRQFYAQALLIIGLIFETDCFLISSPNIKIIMKIAQLILDKDRQIAINSLNLINIIVFYNQIVSDELVNEGNLLTILQARLKQERDVVEAERDRVIRKCIFIICDILITKDRKTRKTIYEHSIWSLIYEAINDHHPLLPTIIVFEYFFQNIGREKTLGIFPNFLNAISALNLMSQAEHIKELKRSLRSIYWRAKQFWQLEEFEVINTNMQALNLMFIMDEE